MKNATLANKYYTEENVAIACGDCLEIMKEIDNESINCCVTSPPYWALRDYQTEPQIWDGDKNCNHDWNIRQYSKVTNYNEGFNQRWENSPNKIQKQSETGKLKNVTEGFCQRCGAWKGSLGLEPTFDLYIKHLCDIFDEVKRVLRKDGTCWTVIGDSYIGSGKAGNNPEYQQKHTEFGKLSSHKERFGMPTTKQCLPNKTLALIPFRFALEMVHRGWILRNTIIWHKPNCMPASVKDRFTVDFEYVFFFVKNKKYYFKQQFEPIKIDSIKRERRSNKDNKYSKDEYFPDGIHANTISQPREYKGYDGLEEELQSRKGRNKRTVWQITTKGFKGAHFAVFPEDLIETPIKAGCPKGGVILDPFLGSGTIARVCKNLGRKCIGIEVNKAYCDIAVQRLKQKE